MIHEVTHKEIWDAFVREHAPRSGAFLSSWDWGEFQKATGKRVRRVIASDDRGPRAAAQLMEMRLPFGQRYLSCPRGPIARPDARVAPRELLSAVARKTRAAFVRIEPESLDSFASAPIHRSVDLSPAHTLLTDLTFSFDALERGLHQKTRYNVRVAQRKGVEIRLYVDRPASDSASALQDAWPLFSATAARGQFRLHPKSYYERMLAGPAFLAVASHEGKPVAANIMVDFQGTRTYLHGASGNEHREVMAPYLLHWALIQEAKHRGLRWYDWWGVAPADADENHPWSGITRFKLGFGGERVDYPGTFDVVIHPNVYRAYQWVRRVRRVLRSRQG